MKSGCFISNGDRSVELEIGWYKGWTDENAYGWEFHGPVSMWPSAGTYRDLIVLDHLPSASERKEIAGQFANAKAPDGTDGLEYPL